MIGRREVIALLGAAAAWPLSAHAEQQPAIPVIGYLGGTGIDEFEENVIQFRKGLGELGYIENHNVVIEFRLANNHLDRLPALAAELVNQQVAAIVATLGSSSAVAAKAATTSIPIVFANGGDPVKLGLVSSLNHPGGNITGISFLLNALTAKRLELLHEMVPAIESVGFLVNPNNPSSQAETNDVRMAAHALGLELTVLKASNEIELFAAFDTLKQQHLGAFFNAADVFLDSQREEIVALAARYMVPAIYHLRHFATAGGLMSYGTSSDEAQRLAGVYAGRILKGEKPGDLPVQQSTKVELVINLKTAKALGITVPLTLLGRADEIIE
jgi:putative tryptophan/tyrosine transport system substrate-binding protein